MPYFDKCRIYCQHCQHQWVLGSQVEITAEQADVWSEETFKEHSVVHEEWEKKGNNSEKIFEEECIKTVNGFMWYLKHLFCDKQFNVITEKEYSVKIHHCKTHNESYIIKEFKKEK